MIGPSIAMGAAVNEATLPVLSVVVPVFNGAAVVSERLSAVVRHLAAGRVAAELIVVDDGSTDDTPARLAAIGAAAPLPCRLFRHDRNQGKGAAISTGMRAARGAFRVFVDADSAYPPAEIAKISAALAAGADVAVASRVHDDSRLILRPSYLLYFLLFLALERRRNRHAGRGLVYFCAGTMLTTLPLVSNYVRDPGVLAADRTVSVWALSEMARPHVASSLGVSSRGAILWEQTRRSVEGFFRRGDSSGQYGTEQPLLSPVTALFALAGLGAALLRLRQPRYQFLILWAGLGLSSACSRPCSRGRRRGSRHERWERWRAPARTRSIDRLGLCARWVDDPPERAGWWT